MHKRINEWMNDSSLLCTNLQVKKTDTLLVQLMTKPVPINY